MRKRSLQPKDLAGTLRESARRITGPRRAVLDVLEREEHPLTIREIHAAAGKLKCDLATIYRSMKMLESVGLVKRFDFGDGSARYELVREGEAEHHHHLVCTGCSKVVEIDECFPAELERKIAAGNGFAEVSHRLEFFGVCPSCQER